MNQGQIEAWILSFLQTDYTNGNWPQSEIQQYIRDEEIRLFVHIVSKDEDFFQQQAFISEVASQQRYVLPLNFYKGIRVERVNGNGATAISPIPMAPVDRNSDAITMARNDGWPFASAGTLSFPLCYQLIGQQSLDLYPPPSSSVTNSILVTYAATPAGMVNPTDVPFQVTNGPGGSGKDNLSEWHDLIAMGACQRALEHEESYPQADRMGARYAQRLAELTNYLAQINVQAPRFVRVTDAAYDS